MICFVVYVTIILWPALEVVLSRFDCELLATISMSRGSLYGGGGVNSSFMEP